MQKKTEKDLRMRLLLGLFREDAKKAAQKGVSRSKGGKKEGNSLDEKRQIDEDIASSLGLT